jgi:hypothetical protein
MIESERMEEYHKRCVVVVSFLEQWDIIISIILEAWASSRDRIKILSTSLIFPPFYCIITL